MMRRFDRTTESGRRMLVETLARQALVRGGDPALWETLAAEVELRQHQPNDHLMQQGEGTNDVCLILVGEVEVRQDGTPVGRRTAGACGLRSTRPRLAPPR